MFGMETPFLLIGIAIVAGSFLGGATVLKVLRIRGKKNEDSKA